MHENPDIKYKFASKQVAMTLPVDTGDRYSS